MTLFRKNFCSTCRHTHTLPRTNYVGRHTVKCSKCPCPLLIDDAFVYGRTKS
jgi:hypothetical protein